MTFRSHAPVAEPASTVESPTVDLVALSVLGLELGTPVEGWPVFLGARGIAFKPDHIGRDSVTVGDAARLMAERRELELRKRAVQQVAEQEAEERDRLFRESLPRGIPWYALDGAGYAEAAAAAEAAQHPSRTPSPGEWLFGETDTMVFHSMEGEGDES